MALSSRTIELADAIKAELDGKTFGDHTLAPTRPEYVDRKIHQAAPETFDLAVAVVPRGKDRARAHRSAFDEEITAAITFHQKLDPEANASATIADLAGLVEAVDDHLAEVAGELAELAYERSEANPIYDVDRLIHKKEFQGVLEVTYSGERELGE